MKDWHHSAVIYQIYPRSFQDDMGNGIGTLSGIRRRLEYVAGLGVDAIWLSPFFESPQKDMGYDVSNYTAVDPLFGDMAAFDALVSRAHALGLKVIIDQVLSHSSDLHPWFRESRVSRDNQKADWYVWADPQPDGSPPNNWLSVFGGPAWEFEPQRGQYYLHNFLASQPDLNFHCEAVQEALLDTVRFWLERGVDGLRLDTVNYYLHDVQLRSNPAKPGGVVESAAATYGMQDHLYDKTQPENVQFLKRLRTLTDQYDDIMMVGEVGEEGAKSIEVMAEYTRGNDRLHMCYSFAMLSAHFSAAHFRNCIEIFQRAAPDGRAKWSFSNHDVMRHTSRWAEHAVDTDALAKQACAMLMSFEGAVGIYQGEELGQIETDLSYEELTDPPALRYWPKVKGRDGCRTPMTWEASAPSAGFTSGQAWLPVKPPQSAKAVDQQDMDGSVLSFYRSAIAFRKSSDCLRHGTTVFVDLPEPAFAFRRIFGEETLTCIFNLSPDPIQLGLSGSALITGPHAARLDGQTLHLPANGHVYLAHEETPELKLIKKMTPA
ncbi:MAG: alpha-glucosidase [Pseudomonadota bacterium]